MVLTALARLLGLVCIWRLRDWNAFGQVAWLTTLIITPLFLVYAYSIIISAQLAPASFVVAHDVLISPIDCFSWC